VDVGQETGAAGWADAGRAGGGRNVAAFHSQK
jgi:hypothetical protein